MLKIADVLCEKPEQLIAIVPEIILMSKSYPKSILGKYIETSDGLQATIRPSPSRGQEGSF